MGAITGTPSAIGSFNFTLQVSDSEVPPQTVAKSLTLTVNSTATAPMITSISNTTFTVGTAGSFAVTTTGSPSPSLTESGSLPSGITFQDNGNGTAALSGTPPPGAKGNYSLTITATNGVGSPASQSFTLTVSAAVVFPLKVSANRRYLVDQHNIPFLMLGDSPQSMMANLSRSDMATYMADRQAHGFNTILVSILVDASTAGNADGTTFDGVAPFTRGTSPSDYDLSTPNSAYFSRLDSLVSMAASHDLLVMLNPIETRGWLTTLENNGATRAFNYGAFLGNRYRKSPNICWQSGNDFQDWNSNSIANNLVYQVMAGIASTDPSHVQTIELDYPASYSNQDQATLGSVLTLDAAYTYFETYDEVLQAYNSLPTLPTFLTEANYEYENNNNSFPGVADAFILREQEYWAMTSGAAGLLYGSLHTWTFAPGWQSYLDSPGALELAYLDRLFNSIPWWNLVPDQNHQIVTAGYGAYDASNDNLRLATYATTAWSPDGSLAVVYDPAGSTLTVNLGEFGQPVTAAWYDPSNGTFTPITGSAFQNSGTMQFATPGKNSDGDSDWVLVLQAKMM